MRYDDDGPRLGKYFEFPIREKDGFMTTKILHYCCTTGERKQWNLFGKQ